MWLGLPGFLWCLLTASFMTRDRFFIDFSLNVVLVIYLLFCFAISALLFLSQSLDGLVFSILAVETESFNDFYCIFILLYWKYKIVAFLLASYIWI